MRTEDIQIASFPVYSQCQWSDTMVGTLAIAGGTVYGGFRLYRYLIEKTRMASWQSRRPKQSDRKSHALLISDEIAAAKMESQPYTVPNVSMAGDQPGLLAESDEFRDCKYGLATASLSLGVTTVGAFLYTPLYVAGAPLLIYMGVPSAQNAYEALRCERRITPDLAETVALAICLGGGYYLVGSVGFTLYYLVRTAVHRQQDSRAQRKAAWTPPQYVCLQTAGKELRVPLQTIKAGNLVVARSGEMVPTNGLITEGTALLKSPLPRQQAVESIKRVGDAVCATEIVQVGQIVIRVIDG
jgi:hypothetical protein